MTYCPLITQTLRIISVRCIHMSLRSKTRRRATLLLPTWIYSCQSVGTVNLALSFTTSVTISISIWQTFSRNSVKKRTKQLKLTRKIYVIQSKYKLINTTTTKYAYSSSHIGQITYFWEFLHEYCEEKSETFTEFYTNLVLTRLIKIIRWCAVVAKNQQKITYDWEFSSKIWGGLAKIYEFSKRH